MLSAVKLNVAMLCLHWQNVIDKTLVPATKTTVALALWAKWCQLILLGGQKLVLGRHDPQRNDTQHNGTEHNIKENATISRMALDEEGCYGELMLRVIYADCHK